MLKTTLGRLLIRQALPPDVEYRDQTLSKSEIIHLFQQLSERHDPDLYRDAAKRLMDVGAEAGLASGGYSFGLKDIQVSPRAKLIRDQVRQKVRTIVADPSLSEPEKQERIIQAAGSVREPLDKMLMEEAVQDGNPLAQQILSGAKSGSLRSLKAGDMLYVDYKDQPIPIPILRGYSEGLSPSEYFAGAYGARKGLVDLKLATQQSGYFGKLLAQAAHRLVVTALDRDEGDDSAVRGLPTSVHDPDNEGALLAQKTGPYPRNTVLSPAILAALRKRGHEHLLVRSPIAGGPPDGGVYARDVGVRERGVLAPVHDNVGLAAAQAVAEPAVQSSISSKHTGGVAGANKGVSGFKLLEQLTQIPTTFPGGATHAQVDGKVAGVEEAPQGGHFVNVGDERHYVPPGLDVSVAPGQGVEAGDVLSSGVPNPAELVQHKGLGEGRRQWVSQFLGAARAAGFHPHRRNLELLARGLINHVRLTEEVGDYAPEEVIPYQTLEAEYQPRDGYQTLSPKRAVGKYLETPVLHHTVGTVIRPSFLPELERYGIQELTVHDEPPPFVPEMIRAQDTLGPDPDWMTRMLGANQERNLLRGAHLGHTSDASGTSFVPGLAKGLGFGTYGKVRSWEPEK
jgi:hypothetical protein